jgi:hypothetical protein
LVADYNEETNEVEIPSDWIQRFKPNSKGEFECFFDCGGHRNIERLRECINIIAL